MRQLIDILYEIKRLIAKSQFDTKRRTRLYREYAGLLKSGISRGEAIEILWKIASRDGRRPNSAVAIVLFDARSGVRNGLSLADSFKSWIPREDYMLIMAIENSDQFADHLDSWCDTIQSRTDSQANAVSSLIYPAILIVIAYGLLMYFDTQIMPSLAEILPQNQWRGTAALFQLVCEAATNYVIVAVGIAVLLPSSILIALPRWSGMARNWADNLPLFSLYRGYCGLYYLQAMTALLSGGLTAPESIFRIRDGASPYFRTRLDLIRLNLLNGYNLGQSMQMVGGGWPDPELALSIQALAHAPDFPSQTLRMSKDWRRVIQQRTERVVAIWRLFAFLTVFGVISGVVTAMYEIQNQIALNI